MATPFRSLVFLGIWKFFRGSSSLDLCAGKGDLLELRASASRLLRRSGASCIGITPSLHPGWSPFWLAVAEVAAEFLSASPPSGSGSPVSAHSESAFPADLGFRAILGQRALGKGSVALTITTPLSTHLPLHPASAIVKMTFTFFSTTAKRCRHCLHARKSTPPNGQRG